MPAINMLMYRAAALVFTIQVSMAFLFGPDISGITPDSIVYLNTPAGRILGRRSMIPIDGKVKQMTIYRGIPYAEAPVGNLRFEKPVAKVSFSETFDATKFGPDCLQTFSEPSRTYSEDCLSLNVYVPSGTVPTTTLKSVMVWIHGGGFLNGAASLYDAHKLSANGDVIVVTINYRLGQLGFLRINSSYVPGNYGLWDQHLAIKWVHDNIGAFGGNASSVTIFGESAGSTSVMFQANYPGNKGLFQRAIAESGSVSNMWIQVDESRSAEATRIFASKLGCNDTNDTMMMQCMRKIPTHDIKELFDAFVYNPNEYMFVPSYDGDFVPAELSEMFNTSPATIRSLDFFNSVDLMVGFNRADGMVFLVAWSELLGKNLSEVATFSITRQEYEDILIPFYLYRFNDYSNVSDEAKSAVVFTYTNWNNPNDVSTCIRNLVNFQTDIYFAVPTLKALAARNISQKHSYLYEFAFKSTDWLIPAIADISDESFANHGDELLFVFDSMDINATSEEIRVAKLMRTM